MPVTDTAQLREILTTIRTVASVGVSSSQDKPSHGIFQYLVEHGYDMIPVNPGVPEIQGIKTYPDLASIARQIDVVQVFRRSEDVPPVVDQAIKVGAKILWMQEGIINEDAARQAEAAGLRVVMNRCMRATHRQLLGEQFSV